MSMFDFSLMNFHFLFRPSLPLPLSLSCFIYSFSSDLLPLPPPLSLSLASCIHPHLIFSLFRRSASCSEGCDLDHGWCRRPDECRCRVGWTGANCTECVPYPGCSHGTCSEPWTCNCDPGYGGITCEEKLDFCEKMDSNPCQNGGTCLSVETSEGGFVCQCTDGHEGHYCERIKN